MALVTFVLLIGATLWTWSNAEKEAMRVAQQAFDFRVSQMRFSILQRLAAYRQTLLGGVGLFKADGNTTRQAWHAYVKALRLERDYPGIQGFGFALHIPPGGLAAHIRAIRAQGFPDYTVTPPGVRADMTAIIYLEPFDWRNQRAFGYDMFSEPVRREAMERARDTGKASATGKVTLVQETNHGVQNGFLMYVPVYQGDAPPTSVAERRARLFGYVYAPFRMNDLMGGILERRDLSDIQLNIYDGNEPSAPHLLYDSLAGQTSSPRKSGATAPAFAESVFVTFGGRVWTLRFLSLPTFEVTIDKQKARLILISGSLISLLMSLVVWSLLMSRERSRRLASANHDLTREIEGRIRLQAELSQAKEVAEAANRAKSEFLANVSHELRTPLTLILAPAGELLAADEPPSNWRAKLARLHQNALRLLNRVNELLDFSKAEAGKFTVRVETVDLGELVGMLAADAAAAAAASHCSLECAVDSDLNAVTIDREHIERILLNLIGNALKFTPPGGTIRVAAEVLDDNRFLLRVKDTGIGIKSEDFSILFERFTQIDSSATRRHGGTGIGLALVKALTDLMGGDIAVHSVVGEGTEFVLTFPRCMGNHAERSDAGVLAAGGGESLRRALRQACFSEGATAQVREDNAAHSAGGTEHKQLLVADDNSDMRAYIRELLSDEWDVVCVEDGEQAWKMLLTRPFDIVVSDVMMPVLDGVSLAERMKSSNALRHVPIILLTARGDSLLSASGLDRGADDYLAKPFSPEELRARLRAAARMSAVQATLREKSREAGMSMLASGILHNLGNVLNSVTASSTLIREQLDRSSLSGLSKVAELLMQNSDDLPEFFDRDRRAALLPGYLAELAGQLRDEHQTLIAETTVLVECCEHAREVITSHHHYALPSPGVRELVRAADIMESACPLARAALKGHEMSVERRYDFLANLVTDRHKVLQILVNLISNAFQALDGVAAPHLCLSVTASDDRVQMTVEDNGAGIEPDHLAVLFNQRFTTRANGNGIGLHSSANWARELGGSLRANSKGPGHGAIFVLDLPTSLPIVSELADPQYAGSDREHPAREVD